MHSEVILIDPTCAEFGVSTSATPRVIWSASIMLSAAIFAFDLLTHSINPSILYLVPLAMMSYSPERSAIWKLLGILIPATYIGYFFGARDPQFPTLHAMMNYRIVNRTFVAVALAGVAGLLHLQSNVRLMIARQRLSGESGDEISSILDAVNRIATLSIAGVVVAAVCITDLFTPGNFNLPILFSIPLAFVCRTGSSRILWALAICLALFAVIGFRLGPGPSGSPEIIRSVTTKRAIATIGILAIAAALHPWMARLRVD